MRLYKQIRFSIVLSELHFNRHPHRRSPCPCVWQLFQQTFIRLRPGEHHGRNIKTGDYKKILKEKLIRVFLIDKL